MRPLLTAQNISWEFEKLLPIPSGHIKAPNQYITPTNLPAYAILQHNSMNSIVKETVQQQNKRLFIHAEYTAATSVDKKKKKEKKSKQRGKKILNGMITTELKR